MLLVFRSKLSIPLELPESVANLDLRYRERFASQNEYESVKDMYVIDNDLLQRAKPTTIVMHPLPRNK
jgi:aspartate carbamoyltransferase catalytic subunit